MNFSKRIISGFLCFVICICAVSPKAHAISFIDVLKDNVSNWIAGWKGEKVYNWNPVDPFMFSWRANNEQEYYTTPTSSEEDQYGNVINYYRGGDTTTTKIIDSYNRTFNTIHNTSNTTNNYEANVKLSDFLNSYATYNQDYTYNTSFKSWYYDNTSNTYNYDASQTYYNTDNSQYYISIDNSTDEYYLVDVKYSPTFVTVNYNYYNTDNSTNYGDVTNIYYFELTDGRNSSTLTADEVGGLALGYDVTNYELVSDDPNTLSLQHFDGDYTDSSSYGRNFYSENRSTNYVDSGAFGQAVKLSSGSAAGVTIPGLSDYDSLAFDFRIYYADISHLGIFLGNTNLFRQLETVREWASTGTYSDHGSTYTYNYNTYGAASYGSNLENFGYSYSSSIISETGKPSSFDSPDYAFVKGDGYGYFEVPSGAPLLTSSKETKSCGIGSRVGDTYSVPVIHTIRYVYDAFITNSISADFAYSSLANQWISMRIVISGGKLYYFVNGDLVGSGAFTMPSADKFYIKSSGTLYLDELRVTTGDMVSTGSYTPSSEPFDTNKVLALPNELAANTIYVRHSTPVNGWRIGGVRPSNPATGFFYLPLHADYTGGQSQLYDGSNWVDVEAMVYDGSEIHSVIGYTFTPVSESPDVDSDLEPGRPPDPGEDVDQSTCIHTWEEASRTEPTCALAGSVAYTCSKCGAKKTESIAKLGHTWEVKTSVPTTYDEEGNVVTQGYTIYKCSVCDEEYKDTDGTGPPVIESPDDSDGGGWFSELLKKIGEFFGTTIGALLELVGTIISKVLDSLITLVTNTVAKLTEVVTLFGSFSESMGTLWGWLPPEIVSVLVAGVTIIVFAAIIRLFFR